MRFLQKLTSLWRRNGSKTPYSSSPYRTSAEMPKEEEPEMETSETIRIWKMVLLTAMSGLVLILGYCAFSSIHGDQANLTKLQFEASPAAREATQLRYLEAKALSDKAMFEQMAKAAEGKK